MPQGFEYHNGNGTLCLLGTFDEETGEFHEEADQAIDYGIIGKGHILMDRLVASHGLYFPDRLLVKAAVSAGRASSRCGLFWIISVRKSSSTMESMCSQQPSIQTLPWTVFLHIRTRIAVEGEIPVAVFFRLHKGKGGSGIFVHTQTGGVDRYDG